MALNVEQITNRLAQMPDAALQKYAALNKNDPYIMALAVSESNRRKQMRQAAQAQQGMQPQPKVVDQAVQGMAAPMPESVGIGQLPAGNMNFADGGLVAFADGGEVERYQSGGAIAPALVEQYKREAQEMGEGRRMQFSPELKPVIEQLQTPRRAAEQDYLQREQARMLQGPALRAAPTATPTAPAPAAPAPAAPAAQPGPTPQELAQFDAATNLYMTERAARQAQERGNAPKVDTTQRAPGAGPGAPAAPNVSGNLASLETLYNRLQKPQEKEYAEVDKERTALAEKMRAFGKARLADFEAEEAKRGDVFKGREERLAQREGELGKLKEQGLGLALLQAGAAMMSTPGSVGMALGKGIDVGAKQYAAGIDKINLAKDRLLEARDRLEELRVNRDDLTAKERRQLKGEADRYVMDADRLTMEGAEKKLGYSREDRKTLFAGMTTILGQEIGAGATLGAARMRSQDQKDYLEALRGGSMVETARKNIMDQIIKANPYADEATRQMLFQKEWTKALQNNPALAKYTSVAPGGGGASSADPLGLR